MFFGNLQRVFLPLAILLLSPAVYACTCVDYGVPACKLFGDADAVFIGTIEKVTPANNATTAGVSLGGVGSISHRGVGMLSVQFSVAKALKGIARPSATALTYSGTSCDLGVNVGQTWLIFANKDGKTGRLGFGACGGNRQLDNGDSDFNELERLLNRSGSPEIRGRISLNQYDGVKGATISLTGRGAKQKMQSDETGSFRFQVPDEGKYAIEVSIPFSARLLFPSQNLPPRFKELEPTETASIFRYDAVGKRGTCDYQYFDAFKIDLKATASISGKFTAADWKSFREFYPDICRLKPTEKETLQSCTSLYGQLQPDGSFTFDGLREGRYAIVVGGDLPNGPEPFYRHFYPGMRDFSKAQAIEIKQGEQRKGIRFKLPSMLPTRRVSGQILTSEGKPAVLADDDDGRHFYLAAYFYHEGKDPELFFQHAYRDDWRAESKGREVEMINSKPDGSFDLELFEGFTYILKVKSGQVFNNQDCGTIKIIVDANLKMPVNIILDQAGSCNVQ